jgi:hypothetical protein
VVDHLEERPAGDRIRDQAQHGAYGRVRQQHEAGLIHHDHRVGRAGQHRAQRAALVGGRLIRERCLERGGEPRRQQLGDVKIVVAIGDRRPAGEEQRAEHIEPPADRHDESRPHAGVRQHALEIVDAVLGREIREALRLARGDRPPRQALVRREHALAHRAILETRERVHEVAALFRVLQADREEVVGHGCERLVAERLEEMRRDWRAEQLDEDLAEPGEPLGLTGACVTHTDVGASAQCARARSARSAPPGTGSIGPTTVTWRITPSLSMRKIPCSCAVVA